MFPSHDIEGIINADKTIANIETQIKMYKKQALDSLKELGYDSFDDIKKIKPEIESLEKEIREDMLAKEEYIQKVNKVKEETENTLINTAE